jgi:hypothetical protein
MKILSLRCQCGHYDYNHTQHFKGQCDYQGCPCQKFSPIAGQEGLTHWADPLGPFAPNYTLCYRLESLKFIKHNPEYVNCPDCLLELKHRGYLSHLEQLAAKAACRRGSKPKSISVRPLDLLTKEQLPTFDKFVFKREMHDDLNYCWKCDYWGCYALGRHIGPLIIGLSIHESIRKEIQMLLAVPGLVAERRRQTDAFIRRARQS